MRAVQEHVRAITAPRHRMPEAVPVIVEEVNRVLRGWGAYFRVGNSGEKFGQVDSYVRERLGLFLSKKAGKSGRRWESHTLEFFQKLGLYQLSGTVRWHKAAPIAAR